MIKVSLNYPVTCFLNHLIVYLNVQSPFTKSCSSKWQQNVAGGSIIKKIHKNLHFKVTFSIIINILFVDISLNCCTYNKYVFLLILLENIATI